jgi:ATP/ADP translocase/HEAT repeat protein
MAALAGRLLAGAARRLGLDAREARVLGLMGGLVAVLLCAYTLAKVLRDALFLSEYGAMALPYAYVGVALATILFVWLEAQLTKALTNVPRAHLSQYMAIVCAVLAALAYHSAPKLTVAAFYLWTGSQAMILLPHFWVLALEVWDSRRARRVFPLLSGCGLLGGIAGGALAAWVTPFIQRLGLIWTLVGLLMLAHGLTRAVEKYRGERVDSGPAEASESSWTLVFRSSYIKVFAIALALSVAVSTLVDFQFKYYVQLMYPEPHALAQFLGRFYVGLNTLALLFQFVIAGWLLQRLGLGASTALQPTTMALLASWIAFIPTWWIVVAMRWIQGVMFQTLGKSSAEIYYAAIRPDERRRLKPALDTIVERVADAAVGVLLIVALRSLGVPLSVIAVLTASLAAVWLILLRVLDRQYGQAFRQALTNRWIEPEAAADWMKLASARRAVLQVLRGDQEPQIVLGLELSEESRDPEILKAVRDCLSHPSPVVRTAAIRALEASGQPDPDGRVEASLADPNEGVRRAAVSYLLAADAEPAALAQRLLERGDAALSRHVVDALFERPYRAHAARVLQWVNVWMSSDSPEERWLAARALGAVGTRGRIARLRSLLSDPDVEVRRAALWSAARQPTRALLGDLLSQLMKPGLGYEARQALVAIGDAAVPALRPLLRTPVDARSQTIAARALAQIASPAAVQALRSLAMSPEVRLRHLGLQSLARARLRTGRPVLWRSTAHHMFLRELQDYRRTLTPVATLEAHEAPEVRLLGESFRESAQMALERALKALACWYDPRPLLVVNERLNAEAPETRNPALEYLAHVLPRRVFRSVSATFEQSRPAEESGDGEQPVAEWIRIAWASDDPWLRACALRASRVVPSIDADEWAADLDAPAIVRAEIESIRAAPPARMGASLHLVSARLGR